jgi:hypothetical protein
VTQSGPSDALQPQQVTPAARYVHILKLRGRPVEMREHCEALGNTAKPCRFASEKSRNVP